jgi:uncharacterized protein (TIGR00369 family)
MSEPDDSVRLARLAEMNRTFAAAVPHNQALGITVRELGDGVAELELPYRADLVGDPRTGVLHGGVITSLMDACCGAAVFMKLRRPKPIATLDLRIDYLMPAVPNEAVLARAECYRVTRHVAFVRGVAFHVDERRLIASAAGSFMLATRMGKRRASGGSTA